MFEADIVICLPTYSQIKSFLTRLNPREAGMPKDIILAKNV
jgi:hypothetical protein